METGTGRAHRTPRFAWATWLLGVLLVIGVGCTPLGEPTTWVTNLPQQVTATALAPTTSPSLTTVPSLTASPSATYTATITPTPPPSFTPTETPTPTITPTYAILRGQVLVLSNCRYGPGHPYLYKYALIPGSNLEVFGRNDLGTWLLVRAIGGTNPCWVRADLMDVRGEVMSVAPTYLPLPQSPYYLNPPTGAAAVRHGDEVLISWDPLYLRAGDDSEWFPYLVEAWLCQDGRLVFTPLGSYETMLTVRDEAGCSEPSHARLYGVEKHGYTRWVEILWPYAGE